MMCGDARESPTSPLPASVSAPGSTSVAALIADADGGALGERLAAMGLDASRSSSFAAAAARLLAAGVAPETRATAFWVPGRIEVLGKHTDYAGGRSLLCAVNRGFSVVAADRDDAVLRVFASFELTGEADVAEVALAAAPEAASPAGWAVYPAVTARRLARNFGIRGGVDLALSCDLPEASGMSSSSAVVIATFLCLSARNRLSAQLRARLPTAEALCHYLGCVENGQDCGHELPGDAGVGTFGGSEDHTAILLCRRAELRVYAFCPTALEATLPSPPSLTWLIAVSGATARKGAERLAEYNNAARAAAAAATAPGTEGVASGLDARCPGAGGGCLRAGGPAGSAGVKRRCSQPPPTLASVTAAAAAELGLPRSDQGVRRAVLARIASADRGGGPSGFPAGALARRYEQFHAESEVLIPAVRGALSQREVPLPTLASLVDRSQALTASHLRNTLEETEWLPAAARRLGAVAASAFGAGFGGSVWALVEAGRAREILAEWSRAYAEEYPHRQAHARFFAMESPPPGACSVV